MKDTDPKFKSYDVIIQNVIQYNKKNLYPDYTGDLVSHKKVCFFCLYFFIYIVSQFLFLVLIITPQLIVQFFSSVCVCLQTPVQTANIMMCCII